MSRESYRFFIVFDYICLDGINSVQNHSIPPCDMKTSEKALTISGLVLAAFVAACRLFRPAADFYSSRLYPGISAALSFIASPLECSLQQILTVAAALLAIVIIVISIWHHRKWYAVLGRLGILGLWIFVWVYIGWGCNYFRSSIYERTGTSAEKYDSAKFAAFLEDYIEDLNESYSDAQNPDLAVMEDNLKNIYASVPEEFGLCTPKPWQHVKRLLMTRLPSKCGVIGFIGPMTDEAHLSSGIPAVQFPFSLAHEFSHVLGVSSEAEANWWAYQICRKSSDPAVRYSAQFSILGYVLGNAGKNLEKAEYRKLAESIRPEIYKDIDIVSEYWDEQRVPALDKFQDWIYDLFLKSNSVSEGIADYSDVVRMLLTLEDFQ